MRHAGEYSDTTPLNRNHVSDGSGEPRAPRHATTRHSRRDRSGEPYEDLLLVSRWMVEHGAANDYPFHIKDFAERIVKETGTDSDDIAAAVDRLDGLTFRDVLGYMSEVIGAAMPDAGRSATSDSHTSFGHAATTTPTDSINPTDPTDRNSSNDSDNHTGFAEHRTPSETGGTTSFASYEPITPHNTVEPAHASRPAMHASSGTPSETALPAEELPVTLQIPRITNTPKFRPVKPTDLPEPTTIPALFPPSVLPTSISPAMPLASFPITLPTLEPIAVTVTPEPTAESKPASAPTEPAATESAAAEPEPSEPESTEPAEPGTGELTPIESAPPSLQESLDMLLFSLDERERAIVTRRIMSEQPSTLDELGKEFNITRERVRQIEKSLRDTLSSLLDGEFRMSERLRAMFEAEGPILRYSTAVRIVPELDITLEPEGIPVLPLIAAVCSPTFSVSDEWLASPSIDDAVKLVKTDLPQAADEYGVVDLTPSASHASSEQRERENRNFADWLSYSGIIMYKDHAIIGRAQNDRAVAVLSIEGHPLTTEEIAERIGAGNARSMRNRLADDERIMRVDVSSWGLRDWNLEEYSGIRQEIRERIERDGGSVKLNDLVRELCSQFSISSRSVMTYAASLPFVSSNGVVTLAGAERFDVPDADPYSTARLFRIDGGWALRITVNAEHARGSGSILPLAVANILGMRFGDSIELDSPIGTQSVYWTGTSVSLGTIRRFIQTGVISVGDDAFLKFMDDGSFALEPVRALNGDALHDALALTCRPENVDERRAFDALRGTIGDRDCSSFAKLAELFAQRGDEDIAGLLRKLP